MKGLVQLRVQKGFEGYTGPTHVLGYLNSPDDVQLLVSTRAGEAGWTLENETMGHEPDGDRIRSAYVKDGRSVSTSIISGRQVTTLLVVEIFGDEDT